MTTPAFEEIARLASDRLSDEPSRLAETFARLLFSRAPAAFVEDLGVDGLTALLKDSLEILGSTPAGEFAVHAGNVAWPGQGERGRIVVTGPDQPFLVDTLRELARARGLTPVELFHPVLLVSRDVDGRITSIASPRDSAPSGPAELVSYSHLEVDRRLDEDECRAIEAEGRDVFREVARVTADFKPMLARLEEIVGRLTARAVSVENALERAELEEAAELLRWLRRSNFVFLGYREYELSDTVGGPATACVTKGSGLGILRDESRSALASPVPLEDLPLDLHERLTGARVVTVYKTAHESRVQRRSRMDYVGVKQYARDGSVCGECRFLGLFTTRAIEDLPSEIPVLRRKLEGIFAATGATPGSHDYKEIFSIFSSLPKSELFVTSEDALCETILAVLDNRDRLGVRVSYRPDAISRGVSVLVLLPRDRFSVEIRQQIQELLARELGGTLIDYRLALTDAPQARLHFYFATTDDPPKSPALDVLEAQVAALTRSWDDAVRDALRLRVDSPEAARLAGRYALAFPPSYRAVESPENAADDAIELDRARIAGEPRVVVRSRPDDAATSIRIIQPGPPIHLSRLMPILTDFGLDVWDELTHRIARNSGPLPPTVDASADHVHRFRVVASTGAPLATREDEARLERAIVEVLRGTTANDALNSLVVLSSLEWRQVDLLRTYTAYLRQLESSMRQRTAYAALTGHPAAAAALVALFEARFDPDLTPASRERAQSDARAAIAAALENVPGIRDDQILRSIENVMLATTRTSWFQSPAARTSDDASSASRASPVTALKIRSADVARMPLPRPLHEIFVTGVALEGVHLRSGKVARGGIRWSDRLDDYRTEVLGLMKAQRTKNALIVPVGAKGGFVLKTALSSELTASAVRAAYDVYIRALLDLTDNVVDGHVVSPARTVIHDEPDPYLVVAADRGTAQFSDLANSIALERGFWLGDAFASGGSKGYNHKAWGITARGAWECISRHLLERGLDPAVDPITVAGIGDMSGDVFGNGLLAFRTLRLIAAFDHRHVFLDPDPDPATSFEERKRLFALPRSSWSDYRSELISAGGGVYERAAKRIRISPEARAMLGLEDTNVNGDELVRAILRMRVDLLFNGGIGTYVRATLESDLEVGDTANERVRVAASTARARVFGEGGNLGATQAARVEMARRGIAVNTDFIDNSGGVDLSDREVNLKILLDLAVRAGTLASDERDALLQAVGAEVCERVLRDNRQQSLVLSLEESRAAERVDSLRLVVDDLEAGGLLQRAVEGVPDDGELMRLRESGMGLARPQLAVLLAYVKIDAFARTLGSGLAERASLAPFLRGYFPARVVERAGAALSSHPLRKEIIATVAVNECVHRMGLVYLHRTARDRGEPIPRALLAWLVADRTVNGDGFHELLGAVESSREVDPATVHECAIRHAEGVEGLARWLLRHSSAHDDLESLVRTPVTDPALEESIITPRAAGDGLPPRLASLLAAALSGCERQILRVLVAETSRPPSEAAAALQLASERLLAPRVRDEARRVVRANAADWQMVTTLGETLEDLVTELARGILGATRSRGDGACSLDLRSAARTLVPDEHALRRRVLASLDALRSREPASVSELFVFVEDLRRVARAKT